MKENPLTSETNFNKLTFEILKTLTSITENYISNSVFRKTKSFKDFIKNIIINLCYFLKWKEPYNVSPIQISIMDKSAFDKMIFTKKEPETYYAKDSERQDPNIFKYNAYLRKMQSLEKIIHKYKNHFYVNQQKQKSIVIEIKLQICLLFKIVLEKSYEHYLSNFMKKFNFHIFGSNELFSKKDIFEKVISLFPDEFQELNGQIAINRSNSKFNYFHFDDPSNESFIGCLLNAFYFSQDSADLQHSLINIIIKFSNQKEIFLKLLLKSELVFSKNEKKLYKELISSLKYLKINFLEVKDGLFERIIAHKDIDSSDKMQKILTLKENLTLFKKMIFSYEDLK